VLGTIAVTLIYVCVNFAFLHSLGLPATASADAAAADVLQLWLGPWAGRFMSTLVCVSCLGAINGLLFTGSRVFYAAGRDHELISWLGKWNSRLDTPLCALLLQLAVTLAMVCLFGSEQGFERLLTFTTPVYWFFAAMVGLSLFILRYKDPTRERSHRVVLYPVTPILFCMSCLFLFVSSVDYARQNASIEAPITIAILVIGAFVSLESGAK
jgi:amino acid transporter